MKKIITPWETHRVLRSNFTHFQTRFRWFLGSDGFKSPPRCRSARSQTPADSCPWRGHLVQCQAQSRHPADVHQDDTCLSGHAACAPSSERGTSQTLTLKTERPSSAPNAPPGRSPLLEKSRHSSWSRVPEGTRFRPRDHLEANTRKT